MLDVQELACVRGDRILFEGLTFQAQVGEVLWVEGANGSGKTSLLRILCGLGSAESGVVRWLGTPLPAARETLTRDMAYVGHANALKDDLTVRENLGFLARLAELDGSDAAVARAVDAVGLGSRGDLPVRALSQGQRRRAALARLWMSRSRKLWILDEPFSALDAATVAVLARLLGEHVSGGGIAVLTTHQEVELPTGRVRRLRLA